MTDSAEYSRAVVAALAPRSFSPRLLARLSDQLALAVAAAPDIELVPSQLADYLASRVANSIDGELHVADLYLACACLTGCGKALRLMQRQYFAMVPRILHSFPAIVVDDVVGLLPERLFVGVGDRAPKLMQYSGRARFGTWFRTVVIKCAQDAQRRRRVAMPLEDNAALGDAIGINDDIERQHSRRLGAGDFRRALANAIEVLSSEQRQLLHGMYVDGLTLKELGAPKRTDPSTTFYRLKRIYAILRKEIKADLQRRLQLSPSEANSFLRSMLSGVDLSITELLSGSKK